MTINRVGQTDIRPHSTSNRINGVKSVNTMNESNVGKMSHKEARRSAFMDSVMKKSKGVVGTAVDTTDFNTITHNPEKQRGIEPNEHLQKLTKKGNPCKVLRRQFDSIHGSLHTFEHFFQKTNRIHNRFMNMAVYDKRRVAIFDEMNISHGDYLHASYVDGFDKPNQYILAQAPHNRPNSIQFWRMVVQEMPTVIILLGPLKDSKGKKVMYPFWSQTKGGKQEVVENGWLVVITNDVHNSCDCDFYDLEVKCQSNHSEPFAVKMLHYLKWENNQQVPDALAGFQAKAFVCAQQVEIQTGDKSAPVVVSCPTGVHRAGTFVALEIMLRRVQSTRRVAFNETVRQLRDERYGVLTILDHYLYLSEAIVQYALQSNCVQATDLEGDAIAFDLRTQPPVRMHDSSLLASIKAEKKRRKKEQKLKDDPSSKLSVQSALQL